MTRLFSLCFFVLLIFVCQESCTANPYETASASFDNLMKLSFGLRSIHRSIVESEEERPWTPKEMKIIQELKALSKNFEEIKSAISTKVSEDLNNRLMQLFDHFQTIQFLYSKFVVMFDNMNTYANSDIKRFANTVTRENLGELHTIAQKMHELLVFEEESIVNAFLEPDLPFDVVCTKTHSIQDLIYDLYRAVVLSHTKQMLMVLFSFNIKALEEHHNYKSLKKKEIASFMGRITRTFAIIKEAMSRASRELKKCDPETYEKDVTYSKLGPIFQGYFVYESDTTRSTWKNFLRSCTYLSNVQVKCKTQMCKNQPKTKMCTGILDQCQFIDKNMHLCHSPIESERRYEWVSTSNGVIYGQKDGVCSNIQEIGTVWTLDTCLCNCISSDKEINRYFSLLPSISDIEANKVITGVRLILNNYVYYIQIKQGTLGSNGTITDQPEWKDVELNSNTEFFSDVVNKNNAGKFGNEFFQGIDTIFTVTRDQNLICLDDIIDSYSQKNRVLTGIRFEKYGDELLLSIRMTEFNYETGLLENSESSWIKYGSDKTTRKSVFLFNGFDSIKSKGSNRESSKLKIFGFGITDYYEDLGQSVVPYIDLQEVVTNPPTPLIGAGLYYKGEQGFGGFMALKLIQYDFSQHL